MTVIKAPVVKYQLKWQKKIKMAKEEVSEPITNCINDSIISDIFPGELKLADIVPTFKKEDQNDKANYRPISLLPLISKLYEKED